MITKFRMPAILSLLLVCLLMMTGCEEREEKKNDEILPFPSIHMERIEEKTDAPEEPTEDISDAPEEPTEDISDAPEESTVDTAEEPEKRVSWRDHESLFSESSGIYRKLKQGEDVNILINGDSIGAGGGSTEGNSWTDLLKGYIESEYSVSCNLTNISLGGNGSYAGYVQENILNDGIDYDLMIICYGENDDRKSVFREYEALIRSAEKKYPSCNIISVLESSQREYTKKIEAIGELSEYYDIPAADTIAAFNESGRSYEDLTVDVKHPNDEGYRLYFEAVKEIIDRETENDTGVENIQRSPLDPAVSEFDTFRYYPVSEFVRTNETTWHLNLNEGVRGIIGLYHLFCPSNGEIIIKTDGAVSVRRPMVWSYDFKQDYIYKPDNAVHGASREIEISFPTAEMADGFKGLIFTGLQ